jgi:hypothetical protein
MDLGREDVRLSEKVCVRMGTVSKVLLQNVIESQHLALILPIIACKFKGKDEVGRSGLRCHFCHRRVVYTGRETRFAQNSLTPYQMIFIMQVIEFVRKAKLPAVPLRRDRHGGRFRVKGI